MANFTPSPGVTLNELDQTFLTSQPIQAGAAIIGPTVKGPNELPTLVTSYSEYQTTFGDIFISGGNSHSYLTSIAAYNYFNYGGESLLVTRVTSGSFSSATSNVPSGAESGILSTNADALLSSFTSVSASAGTYTSLGTTGSISGTGAVLSVTLDTTSSISSVTVTSGGSGYAIGETLSVTGSLITGGVTDLIFTLNNDDIVNSNVFTLETISEGVIMNNGTLETGGTLSSGSKDNIRWEVTQVNTGSGNFNLIVRRGDDNTTNKVILESYNGINLDPESPRFISKIIGDQKLAYNATTNQMETTGNYPNRSRFVRVKSVNSLTPNYLNSLGEISDSSFTSKLPIVSSGSFTNGTGDVNATINLYDAINSNTQGLAGSDYDNMINLHGNREAYQFNLLFTPGLLNDTHPTQITNIISKTQERGDNMFVLDLTKYDGNLADAIGEAQGKDTSYAATYWPWVRIIDPTTGKHIWSPASTLIPGVYAFNDKVAAPWFAPAGINRGGLSSVLQAKFKLTQGNKNDLYENNINPIATFPKQGVVVFGQKTLQKQASALDRVNVRRLMIELKNYIRQIADTVVFEQNTLETRGSFLSRVNPYLDGIQQKQGLHAYKVVMDETNNGPAVIDQNQLVGQIYIQPTRTAEFISLDFILLPTGAEFPA